MCGPVCQNGALCPSGSPTAAPPVLPQNVCPPSCETFVRRLASWRTCVRRAGRGFTSAHEKIGKSGVLSVDGPRGKPSGRRKRKSAKSRRCEAGRPARELPSGGGMPSDGECRPMGNAVRRRFSKAQHGRRQAAGEFCRNTQVKREVIHLSTRLSTMPAFYAVKKPQKRAIKEGTGKGEFPRVRAYIKSTYINKKASYNTTEWQKRACPVFIPRSVCRRLCPSSAASGSHSPRRCAADRHRIRTRRYDVSKKTTAGAFPTSRRRIRIFLRRQPTTADDG